MALAKQPGFVGHDPRAYVRGMMLCDMLLEVGVSECLLQFLYGGQKTLLFCLEHLASFCNDRREPYTKQFQEQELSLVKFWGVVGAFAQPWFVSFGSSSVFFLGFSFFHLRRLFPHDLSFL